MERGRRAFIGRLAAGLTVLPTVTLAATKPAREHTVEIVGAAFVPADLALSAGDSITWVNRDIVPHTATALDNSWDSGVLQKDQQYTRKFDDIEATDYYCRLHPGMRAKLVFG